jgi:hypothetical protein
MPHLVISNIAIGEAVAATVIEASKNHLPVQIIDLGSGSGATLGGIVLGLDKAREMNAHVKNTSIVGIEGTVPMFNQLDDFSGVAVERLNEISEGDTFSKRHVKNPEWEMTTPNELLLICGDIPTALQAIDLTSTQSDGLTIITANYSWHRLPTMVKDRMIKTITSKSKNTIFLIADLVENGSEVNRRYFNFRDNGLLNCGNMHLRPFLRASGVSVAELNSDTAPQSMNPALTQKIGEGVTSDAIFYVAAKGGLAKRIVENW